MSSAGSSNEDLNSASRASSQVGSAASNDAPLNAGSDDQSDNKSKRGTTIDKKDSRALASSGTVSAVSASTTDSAPPPEQESKDELKGEDAKSKKSVKAQKSQGRRASVADPSHEVSPRQRPCLEKDFFMCVGLMLFVGALCAAGMVCLYFFGGIQKFVDSKPYAQGGKVGKLTNAVTDETTAATVVTTTTTVAPGAGS